MKGDFSRDTFDSVKHFSRVLQQQGRVQLDADWNEQTAIVLHYLRTLAADLIGPFAGPQGSSGFEITRAAGVDGPKNDFTIGAGRYYVDGILCENEKEDVAYLTQKDYPTPPTLGTEKNNLVYLDVWERHITALEDDYIREKALGGPDTATRTKVVWQVKIDDGKGDLPTDLTSKAVRGDWGKWIARWQPRHLGCLMARVDKPEEDSKDPCLTAPDAKYRGQENQLYRVEIHKGGSRGPGGEPTFKWSRDNGSVVSRVLEWSGTELVVEKPLGFAAGNWVELINEGQERRGEPGTLIKLVKVEGDRFTLESSVPSGEVGTTRARRWDQTDKGGITLNDGAVQVKEGIAKPNWIELEDGIQIQFMPAQTGEAHHYRTGDYWLIPARVATGDIEWPPELDADGVPKRDDQNKVIPSHQPPFGIRHHYAPLAILKPDRNEADDCRCEITAPLNSCQMSSFGIDGMGGRPLCDTPILKSTSRVSTKSEGADDTKPPRRVKRK